ncbi:MAG: NAD+ synthase [Candidatus Muiribacteriota bacterium]
MKIAAAQINTKVGDIESNLSKIVFYAMKLKSDCDLIVYPECSISGYPPKDLLLSDDFIIKCESAVEKLKEESIQKQLPALVVGVPLINNKKLFNTVLVIDKGEIIFKKYKALLPQYDVFDESHYFKPFFDSDRSFNFKGKKIAVLICEDAWFDYQRHYDYNPVNSLKKCMPDIVLGVSASPYYYKKLESRVEVFKNISKTLCCDYFFVNQTGGNDDIIFDGQSFVVCGKNQEVLIKAEAFKEDILIYDCNKQYSSKIYIKEDKIKDIYSAVIAGIRDYFKKCGFKKAVLGISGGIDSAVAVSILVKALGAENVTGLMLPTRYSSKSSIIDARELAENLGFEIFEVNIEPLYKNYLETLAPFFKNREKDFTEENIQARIRGNILMAYSNKFSHLLVTTGNKSEISVGYTTLYGDMCGAVNPIGDILKTDIFKLARFINKNKEIIPENIIIKPPSAELSENQKDEDSLPLYEVLDEILRLHIEENKGVQSLITKGFKEETVKWVLNQVKKSEFKRSQSPVILKVSKRAFGRGWRMPIVKS